MVADKRNQVVFKVASDATKPEIKQENMSVEPKTEKIGNPLNTSDILLQLFDKVVKQQKDKARNKTIDDIRTIISFLV